MDPISDYHPGGGLQPVAWQRRLHVRVPGGAFQYARDAPRGPWFHAPYHRHPVAERGRRADARRRAFSTRGYNIESLSVAATDDPTVSRITLVTKGSDAVIQQIVNQLNKLIDVVSVEDMTTGEHIERELVLLKLKVRLEQADAVRGYVVRHGGRVIDPASDAFIVELTASEAEINRFITDLSSGAELLEVVRSGALGISRLGRNLRVVR